MKSIFIVYLFEIVDVNTYFVIVNLVKLMVVWFRENLNLLGFRTEGLQFSLFFTSPNIANILHFPQQIRNHIWPLIGMGTDKYQFFIFFL
jgi:hypothetical protein